jgi:hypothetical protein
MNQSAFSRFLRGPFPVYLLLLLVLAFNVTIRWRLRDMPLERDEGEYAYAGQLILQGIPPYQLAYNMKFPGVYFSYALLMGVFGQSVAGIHTGMILVTTLTTALVFLIGRRLLGNVGGLLASAIYVCLSALPGAAGLAGHATHFVNLFICAGVLALLTAREKKSFLWWSMSGTAFGLAILMKQHAVFFPAFILVWFLWKEFRSDNRRESSLSILVFCGGCLFPFLITAVGFAGAGLWGKFIFWTFQYAREYVSMLPLAAVPRQFAEGFDPVFECGKWVWFSGIAGLFFLLGKRERNTPVELAGLIFLAALAAACPGFYFRNHYFLMAMPGLALLNAVFILAVAEILKNSRAPSWLTTSLPLGLAAFILGNLLVNNGKMWFAMTPLEVSRTLYGPPFAEVIPVADYLKKNMPLKDTVAVLGSEPEIFFLSNRRSASGYIYLYSLTEPQPLASQMRTQFISEIQTARPKYMVVVNDRGSWYSVITSQSLESAAYLQKWWANYSTNYALASTVEFFDDKPSKFIWDNSSPNVANFTYGMLIYRRK